MKTEHPFIVSINRIEKLLEELTRKIKLKQIEDPELIILDNTDFLQLLKISSKTAQNWREEGLIAYSKPSSIIQ